MNRVSLLQTQTKQKKDYDLHKETKKKSDLQDFVQSVNGGSIGGGMAGLFTAARQIGLNNGVAQVCLSILFIKCAMIVSCCV